MIQETYRGAQQWSRSRQAIATVVWISFLSAAIGSVVLFALLDPVVIAEAHGSHLGREAGYAVGFFFLWFVSLFASAITAWLVRTAPKRSKSQ